MAICNLRSYGIDKFAGSYGRQIVIHSSNDFLFLHGYFLRCSGAKLNMDQEIIARAVNLATSAALNGHPIESAIWIPPQTAASDPRGVFIIQYAGPMSTSGKTPGDK